MAAPKLFYKPTPADIEDTVVEKFRRFVNHHYSLSLKDTWAFYQFSIDRPNDFYRAAADFCNCIIDYDPVKPLFDESKTFRETRQLVNGSLNWAENMLMAHANRRSKTQKAVIACQESAFVNTLTYEELYQQVRLAAEGLRQLGVKEGDRVALFSPNNAEAVVMLLATTTIGAIYTSTSTEFGVKAVVERLEQLSPLVLLTADSYRYAGKNVDVYPKLEEIMSVLVPKGLKHVVVVGQLSKDRQPKKLPASSSSCRVTSWPDFLKSGSSASPTIQFNRGPANRPLWVLYSSGTTGKPKAIVHSAGGMLLQAATAHVTSLDSRPTDVALQFTTLSWMMHNHQMSYLMTGCTIVLFDGSPLNPLSTLWSIVETHKVTVMGVSPRFIQVLALASYSPRQKHNLSSLRTIGLTGAPAPPEVYNFIKNEVKSKGLWINNASGGTDICAALVVSNPTLPMHFTEIQMPNFGARIEAWSDAGEPVESGKEGNMVCTNMLPNMPLYFWNDLGDERYRSTYFESFPNKSVWNQSDWISINGKTRGITMHGRSDGVLNPQGVRFGSAELYQLIEKLPGIDDVLAVGQKVRNDERVILFVKTQEGKKMDSALVESIRQKIKTGLSTRHVPAVILQAPDLPYTNNLKRCEIAVKKVCSDNLYKGLKSAQIINGTPLSKISNSGMMNPASLEWFVNRKELAIPQSKL